jgi:hypothetical protein
MRRSNFALLLVVLLPAVLLAGCSSSGTQQLPTTLPPSPCLSAPAAAEQTLKVHVSDRSGGLSANTSRPLVAGPARIDITADGANDAPVTVRFTHGSSELAAVRGVAPGGSCSIDVKFVSGDYMITQADRTLPFHVADTGAVTP